MRCGGAKGVRGVNYDEGGLIGTYVSQFGLPMGKGRTYLEQIVALDVENEFRTDCEMYVKIISRRHGITATAVKQAIGRFLSKGWNMGYVEGWKKADPLGKRGAAGDRRGHFPHLPQLSGLCKRLQGVKENHWVPARRGKRQPERSGCLFLRQGRRERIACAFSPFML